MLTPRKLASGGAALIGMAFLLIGLSLASTVTPAGAWPAPSTSVTGTACVGGVRPAPVTFTIENNESGYRDDPGRISNVSLVGDPTSLGIPSTLTFTPNPVPNTGDSTATASFNLDPNYEGKLTLRYHFDWRGDDGYDEKFVINVVKCTGIEQHAKALCEHQVDDTEWHFVITQTNETQAPAFIHVTWANGNQANVPLDKVTGGVAHYATTENLDSDVTDATAVLVGVWSGQFNLSHGPKCGPGDTTTTSSTSTSTSTTSTTEPTTTTSTTEPTTTTSSTSTSTSTSTTSTTEPTTTTSTTEPTTTTSSTSTSTTSSSTTSTTEPTTTTTEPETTTTTEKDEETTTTTGVTTTVPETTTAVIESTTTTVCEERTNQETGSGGTSEICGTVDIGEPTILNSLPVTGQRFLGISMIVSGVLLAGGMALVLTARQRSQAA